MASADVVQLKEKAAITGKILAEKPDQIVVDVGYTVLVIPRSQVEKISRTDAPEPAAREVQPPAKIRKNLYYAATTPPAERPVREWVSQVGEAVVQVRTPSGLGSGFIINEDGYLITNFHVIEGETQISVEVYHQKTGPLERRTYKRVRIIAMNKFADLALLKIEDKDIPKFTCVLLGNADNLAVGERVFAIGSPLGLERTVTEGIISTKTREVQGSLYLQTTAQINPGNSGGPLFNLRGEVVGVTNMKVLFGEGIGFAIPIDAVVYFLDHRDSFAYDNDNPNNPYRYLEPPSRLRPTQSNEDPEAIDEER
ncbi:MAG: trypsin-like peptidase domain-containing protein [Candidatus Omnitrophica bacterium]|nr:trypsin-like peptidase domain-containing protein [Candidatus Omnitrophota bacterium]